MSDRDNRDPDWQRVIGRSERDLDDMAKARVWNQLEPALAGLLAPPRPRSWRAYAYPAVAALAGAAVATVILALWPQPSREHARAPGGSAPVAGRVASPVASDDEPVVRELHVPNADTLRAQLDDGTRIVVRGPANLSVTATSTHLRLQLVAGVLHVDRARARTERVEVNVPGRLRTEGGDEFEVEATFAGQAVAVAKGRVELVADGKTVVLGAGQSWRSRQLPVEYERTGGTEPATAARTPHTGATVASTSTHEPVAATPVDAAPPTTAESLYQSAEAAMRAHDSARAEQELTRVVTEFPTDELADTALYELARLAFTRGDATATREHLDALQARGSGRYLEQAALLSCRLYSRAGQLADSEHCWQGFRARYPDSPHDAEALAVLASETHKQRGCRAAAGLLGEYLRRYPDGPFAQEARQRQRACQEPR